MIQILRQNVENNVAEINAPIIKIADSNSPRNRRALN